MHRSFIGELDRGYTQDGTPVDKTECSQECMDPQDSAACCKASAVSPLLSVLTFLLAKQEEIGDVADFFFHFLQINMEAMYITFSSTHID